MSKAVLNELYNDLVEEPVPYKDVPLEVVSMDTATVPSVFATSPVLIIDKNSIVNRVLTPDKTSGFPANYHLTQDWVAVKMDAPKTEIGGIALPEVSVERPFSGTIVALGETANTVPMGAKVWFGKFAGSMYDLDEPDITEKELLILREEDIILWRD